VCVCVSNLPRLHLKAASMEELFRTADVHSILDFTKETHFYSKL